MKVCYDLIIVGGGPTGINCAIKAKKAGLSYLILEKGFLVNSIYNFPSNMTFFSTSVNLEIGKIPFISHSDKPTRNEALEYYRRIMSSYELNIKYNQEVKIINDEEDFLIVRTKDKKFKSNYLILATGFYDHPKLLNIPGECLPKVKHYYDDAHQYIAKKIVVVGGANSACDVALETWQKGADVTMVVREKQLYEKVKYWILPNIKNRIKEGAIKAYFNCKLNTIKEKTVVIQRENEIIEIDNDIVLAMTGYIPNYPFLERIGIAIDDDLFKTPVYNESSLESNKKNIYLAGVLLGGLKTSKYFIENTRNHADIIIDSILEKRNKTNF